MEAAGKRWILHGSRSDEFTIWNLSDVHLGNRACAVDLFKADVERIRTDPHSFFVGGGDYTEAIGFTDKRFDPDSVAEHITVKDMGKLGWALTEQMRDLLKPIRHKCLGLLLGNHEKKLQQAKEQSNLHAWLCGELGVPNIQYSAFFDAVFVRVPGAKAPRLMLSAGKEAAVNPCESFRFVVHHGAGFAQTPGGKLNRLIQFMEAFDADVFMVGHVHDQKGQRLVRVGADRPCTKLVARESVGVISGSYLKTYAQGVTTYGEQRGYRPVPLGAAFVKILPETRRIFAEI